MAKFTITQRDVAFKNAEFDFLTDAVKRSRKEALRTNAAVTIVCDNGNSHIFDYTGEYFSSRNETDGEYKSDYLSRC